MKKIFYCIVCLVLAIACNEQKKNPDGSIESANIPSSVRGCYLNDNSEIISVYINKKAVKEVEFEGAEHSCDVKRVIFKGKNYTITCKNNETIRLIKNDDSIAYTHGKIKNISYKESSKGDCE